MTDIKENTSWQGKSMWFVIESFEYIEIIWRQIWYIFNWSINRYFHWRSLRFKKHIKSALKESWFTFISKEIENKFLIDLSNNAKKLLI